MIESPSILPDATLRRAAIAKQIAEMRGPGKHGHERPALIVNPLTYFTDAWIRDRLTVSPSTP